MKKISLSLLVYCVLGVSLVAYADDVPPPPSACPEGSLGRTNHGGPYCAPVVCKADADCQGGAACRDLALCIKEESYSGGRRPTDTPLSRSVAVGACDAKKACAGGASCAVARYCAPAVAKDAPAQTPSNPLAPSEPRGARSCAVSPAEGGSRWWCLLSLLLLLRRRSPGRLAEET